MSRFHLFFKNDCTKIFNSKKERILQSNITGSKENVDNNQEKWLSCNIVEKRERK